MECKISSNRVQEIPTACSFKIQDNQMMLLLLLTTINCKSEKTNCKPSPTFNMMKAVDNKAGL